MTKLRLLFCKKVSFTVSPIGSLIAQSTVSTAVDEIVNRLSRLFIHVSFSVVFRFFKCFCIKLNSNITFINVLGNGQDLNCAISSLTQLMLDPYFRTKFGFQSLIQKDWVAIGHPFVNRLGHILSKDIEQSPIFLLFLDCVWQLIQQYPTAFQFSETYVTTIWDSAHISLFETFLFNCEHDRIIAECVSCQHC